MKWTLTELRRYQEEPLQLALSLELADAMIARFPEQILALTPVALKGFVTYDRGDATVAIQVKTTVTTPSTRSLTPVELALNFAITENYLSDPAHLDRYDENEDLVFELADDRTPIDLDEIVIENIIEQLPGRVLTPAEAAGEAMPTGKDWEVIEEGHVADEEKTKVDPRLAKLKTLFPDQDEKD